MQLPTGKPAKLLQRLCGFEGEQKLAQLVGHRGRHSLGLSVLVELLEPFVAKADKLHVVLVGAAFIVYGLTVHVKPFIPSRLSCSVILELICRSRSERQRSRRSPSKLRLTIASQGSSPQRLGRWWKLPSEFVSP